MKPFGVITSSGKFVNNEILQNYAVKEGESSKQIPVDAFAKTYSADGLLQPLYNPEALARALELNTFHYRACKTKARDAGGLGWELQSTVEEGNQSKQERERIEAFLNNQDEAVSTLFTQLGIDKESIGYGAFELIKEDYLPDGEPQQWKHIPSHTLRRSSDERRVCQIRGGRKRWFKLPNVEYDLHCDTGKFHEVGTLPLEKRATEVVWTVNYTPRSDFYGIPDVIPALPALYAEVSREKYNISFFEGHGVPSYAVFITGNFDPGELDEDGKSEFEKSIEDHFTKLANNPQSTLILSIPTRGREDEVNIQFQALNADVKDASFRMFRKDNTEEILSAHAVPPYRAGIAKEGSLGGSTAREATEIYKRSVIEPRQEEIENLVNKHIIREGFGFETWKFKLIPIDLQDEKEDLQLIQSLFQMGAITPNQIIRHFQNRFGLEVVEDEPMMDMRYIGGQPVDNLAQDETEQAMLSLEERLLEVAKKDARIEDGFGNAYPFEGAGRIKKHTS